MRGARVSPHLDIPDAYNLRLIGTAEATTLQLEFRDLAEVTGKKVLWGEGGEGYECGGEGEVAE
jgi:hypothetical protein